MTAAPEPMTRARLAEIETAINSPAGPTTEDIRQLLAETKRARADSDKQYRDADYWRESYRLARGLSDEEIGAIIAVRDATPKPHRPPCWFPHEACVCGDEGDEGEHEECLGIHTGADGYRDCDGNPI